MRLRLFAVHEASNNLSVIYQYPKNFKIVEAFSTTTSSNDYFFPKSSIISIDNLKYLDAKTMIVALKTKLENNEYLYRNTVKLIFHEIKELHTG